MSLDLHDNRQRINRYLDELEQLARDVDSYLTMHRGGFEAGIEYHREQLEKQLERVRVAARKEGTAPEEKKRIRDVLVELGFNDAWQAAWDDLCERKGWRRRDRAKQHPFGPEIEAFAAKWEMYVLRPDHGGLPWTAWLFPTGTEPTEEPICPYIDVRLVDGKVQVRIIEAQTTLPLHHGGGDSHG